MLLLQKENKSAADAKICFIFYKFLFSKSQLRKFLDDKYRAGKTSAD